MAYQGTKRRVFISHHKADKTEVDAFINQFAHIDGVFTPYVLGANNNDAFINSTDTNYVMSQIRSKYLQDTTVTIVLVGSCTHSRRYVDWELKSSLTQGSTLPNGLMGIVLPSQNNSAHLPDRLKENWQRNDSDCYARYWSYPNSAEQLGQNIEDAFSARTVRAHLIKNSRDMMKYNAVCKVHEVTH